VFVDESGGLRPEPMPEQLVGSVGGSDRPVDPGQPLVIGLVGADGGVGPEELEEALCSEELLGEGVPRGLVSEPFLGGVELLEPAGPLRVRDREPFQ